MPLPFVAATKRARLPRPESKSRPAPPIIEGPGVARRRFFGFRATGSTREATVCGENFQSYSKRAQSLARSCPAACQTRWAQSDARHRASDKSHAVILDRALGAIFECVPRERNRSRSPVYLGA